MMKKRQKGTIYNKNVTKSSAHTHTHTHTNQQQIKNQELNTCKKKKLFEEHREND